MKGLFSIWAFFGITMFIDIISLLVFFVGGGKETKVNPFNPLRKVSVLIPIHKENEEDVIKTVEAVYEENYPVHNVIICDDSNVLDKKPSVNFINGVHGNLIYIKCPYQSKVKKINYIVREFGYLLGDFLYVRDCKARGNRDCIEKMMVRFNEDDVAAVTSYGRLSVPKNFLSRAYYYGKSWINEVGRFRKIAQEKRRAIFVVCGASTIYRTDILRKLPMPYGSKTEDTYYTWVLQEKGYRINVADNAIVSAPEVDGEYWKGIRNQIKQSYRWSSGTIQCMYRYGRDLTKNKRLFYTTIFPGFMESLMYSVPLVLLPLLFFLSPFFVAAFIIGDTVFSLLGTLVIIPRKFLKTLFHYPQVMFFKYVNGAIFVVALFVVTSQAIFNKTDSWSNEWIPPQTALD